MSILVTGGTGFIGSHTVVELFKMNYDVVIIDNLSNSKKEVLNRIKMITNKSPKFYMGDISDSSILDKIFTENKIDSVIHFAGLKAVGESNDIPLKYYENNIGGTINLLKAMERHGVKNIVFSSSATVYGDPERVPIDEECRLDPTNPYGRTKLFIEYILEDLYKSNKTWNVMLLRYFNPIGAHESGLIGEDPSGIPNNLIPYVTQTAIGKFDHLRIWGNDYDTLDGTGVRDYIHVVDLAIGHIKAIEKINKNPGLGIYNLGTGRGCSVLEIVNAFSRAIGRAIPYKIYQRRPGDIATCYTDPSKAERELGFVASKTLEDMCKDQWNWQTKNPNGYDK